LALPFDIEAFRFAVRRGRIEWHSHALERMVQRGILRTEVKEVLLRGEIIEEYPKDYPLPSALFLGRPKGQPLHAVAAFNMENGMVFIITAYEPDLKHFERDMKTRRKA
jgi:hypothetical protein